MYAEAITAPRLVAEFTVTADDHVDGSRAYYRNRPWVGWAPGTVITAASLAALLLTHSLWTLAGVACGVLFLSLGRVRWLDRLMVRSHPNARLGTYFEIELTATGVRFENEGVIGLVTWSAITDVRDGERAIMLISGEAPLVNLPKRAFRSRDDLEMAIAYIASKVVLKPAPPRRNWILLWLGAVALAAFVTSFLISYIGT